ncbi:MULTISPECIES: cation:dicarboxylase symporter family transporter [unclassified Lysobacter]|uniref:dicarboxylate/amino acid:cation symporter n=1 Tax=unclassified Lysobacter TaxID=2635362 RepID=UPI0007016EC7|nr:MULTISPECIES: cation:dicarboxylase symporter family transporter [unclassified Lysobacter]KQZ60054.1 sodium:dicarboxylate symporter [Lysobacter sp. Root559]KRC38497.1 sodium:dicarboxylate symporter [Lysobacter sp. Root76]KRD71306.1 sodium:dicarboxylate symporter [Lysobacter sp. Root96]
MSMTTRVLLALIAGAAAGLILVALAPEVAQSTAAVMQPIGKLWLNALQMTVVPLVVSLVVIGVTSASDAAASGRTARRAIVVFIVLLSLGAAFAAIAAPALLSLLPRDEALVQSFRTATSVPTAAPPALGDWLSAVIPSNVIAAAAASAMLPLVVFALFFGFALTRIDPARRARLVELFQAIADTMIVIVRWLLWIAPLGVFALMFAVCAHVGVGMLGAVGYYIALQCTLYISVTLMLYLVAAASGTPLRRFAAGVLPAQTIAASTQSSLASLPAMVDSARMRLGYPLEIASLVLPMAVSLFRITSPIQYIGVTAFVAWIYGIDLGAAQLAGCAALAVVISLGSVGLPGQVSFMATNMPVVQAASLPVEPLGLLLAVDTLPDVFATLGNVTGDIAATGVVAGRERAATTGDGTG